MSSTATITGGFQVCPPLDFPLRLRKPWGSPGFSGIDPANLGLFPTDHFAAVTPTGEPGLHAIHEGVDLESGVGNTVFAAYSGLVEAVEPTSVTLSHHDNGVGFATRYIHVSPATSLTVGDRVPKGAPIATVSEPPGTSAHLHFELWHWIGGFSGPLTDRLAVPVDPTRMLYRWEQVHGLDYAVLGTLPTSLVPVLDATMWGGKTVDAYRAARIEGFESTGPEIEVLAPGSVWRVTDGSRRHLLRLEDPAITVVDEAYGTRVVSSPRLERVGFVPRRDYPVFVVHAAVSTARSGGTGDESGLATVYAIPMHEPTAADEHRVALLRQAFEQGSAVELQVRRSAYWSMDGSIDEVAGVVEAVTVLG